MASRTSSITSLAGPEGTRTMESVKDTKQFWSHMPYHICNNDNVAASPTKDDSCWNGAMKASWGHHAAKQGRTLTGGRQHGGCSDFGRVDLRQADPSFPTLSHQESSYGSGSGSGDGIDDTKDDVEGSGNFGTRVEGNNNRELGSKPIRPTNINTNNAGENTIHVKPKNTTAGTPAAVHRHMSVTRAVATYLLPIVVIWFGGIFSDWL
uniref:Uncharacterized protein n=1 Tax=Timema poppense TaxID=170557 RepID=A0A7R9HCW7_TIMPO|nr:unnamed protein product [Timema poppensis]